MAYREAKYEANGHNVTILQVNEGGTIHGWIDGFAAHLSEAMENEEPIPDPIVESVQSDFDEDNVWSGIRTFLSWMVDNDYYYCTKCESFYDSDDVVRTHFAGHKCKSCDMDDKYCPDNPNGDSHDDRCLNPRQKSNARVPTKYKCKHCGRKRQTTPTG